MKINKHTQILLCKCSSWINLFYASSPGSFWSMVDQKKKQKKKTTLQMTAASQSAGHNNTSESPVLIIHVS